MVRLLRVNVEDRRYRAIGHGWAAAVLAAICLPMRVTALGAAWLQGEYRRDRLNLACANVTARHDFRRLISSQQVDRREVLSHLSFVGMCVAGGRPSAALSPP